MPTVLKARSGRRAVNLAGPKPKNTKFGVYSVPSETDASGRPTEDFIVNFVPVRKRRVEDLRPVAKALCQDYTNGLGYRELMTKYHTTYPHIAEILAENKVDIRKSGRAKGATYEAYGQKHLITPDKRDEILRLDLTGGMTLSQIGDMFNITRERVRQICQAAGHPARYSPRVKKARAEPVRQARTTEPSDQITQISKMWNGGLSALEIAKKLKRNPNSMGVQISRWRHRWPNLFESRYNAVEAAVAPEPKRKTKKAKR